VSPAAPRDRGDKQTEGRCRAGGTHGEGVWGSTGGRGRSGQGRDRATQRGAGAARCGAGAVQPPCSAGCRVGAARCRATQRRAGAASPPGTLALTAQEGLDMADELPQLLVGALHAGPGPVRLVQGRLCPQPGFIRLPLGLRHLGRGRNSAPVPRAGGHGCAACSHQCPCATHPVGELGHVAGGLTQLLLGMACPVQCAVGRGHRSTAAQTPAAPCPVLVPAPSSPAGALGTGNVARRTADLQGIVGSGRLWGPSPRSPPRVPPSR